MYTISRGINIVYFLIALLSAWGMIVEPDLPIDWTQILWVAVLAMFLASDLLTRTKHEGNDKGFARAWTLLWSISLN